MLNTLKKTSLITLTLSEGGLIFFTQQAINGSFEIIFNLISLDQKTATQIINYTS